MNNSGRDILNEIHVQNIVATASISKTLDLNEIESILPGCEYDTTRFPGLIYHQEDPKTACLLFSSGKVVCTGAKTTDDVETSISNVTQLLSGSGLQVDRNPKISVQNIVATCNLNAEFNLNNLAMAVGLENIEYEPEQFPGLVYRVRDPKVVILIFSSGKLVCTGGKTLKEIGSAVESLKSELALAGLL